MRRPLLAVSSALVALLLVAGLAEGHDTWLLPTRATVPPGLSIVFDLTSGMAFPTSATAIEPARVGTARLRLGGRTETLPAPTKGARSLRYDVFLRRPGIATLWVELAPRTLELDEAEVREYLTEIGAADSVRYRYMAQPIPRRWRERYAKYATTYVRVASPVRPLPVRDSSWATPTGMAFELVPERDPTALHAGDMLVVRLVRHGAPVAGGAVGLTGPGATGADALLRRTGADGRVAFIVPRSGRWLVRSTEIRHATSPDLDWETDFATLTVVVR
jgi:uncharacterized GH25 family protein